MGKIISDRLLKQGVDPLPTGQTVFSYRISSRPTEPPAQQDPHQPDQAGLAPVPLTKAITVVGQLEGSGELDPVE